MRGPRALEYWLMGGGAVMLALSTILPWINIIFVGDVSLFRLAEAAHHIELLPLAMVTAGLGIGIVAFRGMPARKLAQLSAATVALTVLLGGGDFIDLVRAVNAAQGLAALGFGVFVALAALISMGVGSIRVLRSEPSPTGSPRRWKPPTKVTTSPPVDRSPGWKQDPWGVVGTSRYWDGSSWTSEVVHRDHRRGSSTP